MRKAQRQAGRYDAGAMTTKQIFGKIRAAVTVTVRPEQKKT